MVEPYICLVLQCCNCSRYGLLAKLYKDKQRCKQCGDTFETEHEARQGEIYIAIVHHIQQ